MPNATIRIKLGEATQRLNKRKGKGSDDIAAALSPQAILAVKGTEKARR